MGRSLLVEGVGEQILALVLVVGEQIQSPQTQPLHLGAAAEEQSLLDQAAVVDIQTSLLTIANLKPFLEFLFAILPIVETCGRTSAPKRFDFR